jgi:hypothetical protein
VTRAGQAGRIAGFIHHPSAMLRFLSFLPRPAIRLALIAGLLAGCGAGSPVEPLAQPSIGARMEQLERSGALPILDRSDSLEGPDANGNQVRDDIEQWIATQAFTAAQQNAAMQFALAIQLTLLVDTGDPQALQRSGDRTMGAISCIFDRFDEIRPASGLVRKLEAITMNTRARVTRYIAYNKARSGSVTILRNEDTCEP